MGGRDEEPDSEASIPSFRFAAADPRKFTDYMLVPGHPSGKDRIFLQSLGYRPYHERDARSLAAIYVAQASERFAAGDYSLGNQDRHGQRFAIVVTLRGRRLRSGWILRPDGILWLASPFVGFVD